MTNKGDNMEPREILPYAVMDLLMSLNPRFSGTISDGIKNLTEAIQNKRIVVMSVAPEKYGTVGEILTRPR